MTTKKDSITHVHQVASEGRDYAYSSRVADAEAAAGNIEREQRCSCGATRWAAINGHHAATSSWTPAAYAVVRQVADHKVESTHPTYVEAAAAVQARPDRAAYVARTHRQVGDSMPADERVSVYG